MKTLITALAVAALLAAPAFTLSAVAQSPNDVMVGDKYVGTDPDANVRLQLRRDVGSEGFWSQDLAPRARSPSQRPGHGPAALHDKKLAAK
jgi:hypothetical protein